MKKGEKHILYGIIGIVVIFLLAMQMGYLTQYGFPPIRGTGLNQNGGNNNNNNGGNTPTDYSQGIGKYQLGFQALNTSNLATLAFGTDLDAWVLHYQNGQYVPEGGSYSSSSTSYFTATAADNGYMWIEVKPHSTTYYVDYQTTAMNNPSYVVGTQYVNDPLKDGHRDFIFQYNLKNQPTPSAGSYPVVSFSAYGLCYDSSFPGMTGLGNQSSIGVVSVPKYYENDVYFSNSGMGVGVYKVEVLFGNSTKAVTDQTKVSLTSVQFPGEGTISGQSFNVQYETQDIRYSYTISTSLYGADYVWLPANANNKFPINTQVQWTLSSLDEIPVTINIYYFNNAGVGQKATTTFYANE